MFVDSYLTNLISCFTPEKKEQIFELAKSLKEAWRNGKKFSFVEMVAVLVMLFILLMILFMGQEPVATHLKFQD